MRTIARTMTMIAALGLASAASAQTSPRPTTASAPADGGMAKVYLRVVPAVPAEGSLPMNQFVLVDDKVCGDNAMTLIISHNTDEGVVKHTPPVCAPIESGSYADGKAKAQFPVVSGRPADYSVMNGSVLLVQGGCGPNGYTIIGGGHRKRGLHRAVGCATRG